MATDSQPTRLALSTAPAPRLSDGTWWPRSRRLTDELDGLFALWPAEQGRIARVLYSPPDWEDRPRSVQVTGRRVKTGCFPHDDTHVLVLSMLDGRRVSISVIAPDAPLDAASKLLADVAAETAHATGEREDVHA
ncbi:DUF5994 family protein [Nocardioides sp. Iso805N]|uniref:DUF5994 family protein n=1 Tax=Nocardioides sp. Iso805N TaxID=1283287 RepID=UPI0003769B44|nr:DUF5994 family protein [Nocardioides sp. Iso805N]